MFVAAAQLPGSEVLVAVGGLDLSQEARGLGHALLL